MGLEDALPQVGASGKRVVIWGGGGPRIKGFWGNQHESGVSPWVNGENPRL
jgi:hypothetical protein